MGEFSTHSSLQSDFSLPKKVSYFFVREYPEAVEKSFMFKRTQNSEVKEIST